MTIELIDMDRPYKVDLECNSEGKNFIRIIPNSLDASERYTDCDICLEAEDANELARVLMFLANEIK